MSLGIAICDDEQAEIHYLQTLVTQWAQAAHQNVRISVFPSAEAFLFTYSDDKSFDILLLDIQMGEMDGVALAKKIRLENKNIQIIFITGYMDYISDGYEVEALHYLLKPITSEKLFATLNRATNKLANNERALYISHSSETTRVPLYEIRYLEVQQNYVTIHTSEKITVKKTLGELEKDLDDRFFRIGRSFIVNLRFVRKITKTEVHLSDGTLVPLSRGFYREINQAMINHF